MKRLAFDARTIGDHYPGIGRYAFGVWQALADRVTYSIIDPTLRNTRFKIGGLRRESFGVRSPLAQIDLPLNCATQYLLLALFLDAVFCSVCKRGDVV